MERGEQTTTILRQFKRKSKRVVNKDFFTEFFYFNKARRVIEFLQTPNDSLYLGDFFKEFLPIEFREFISVKILNDVEEEVKTWYIDEENCIIALEINWGDKKQEISIELCIENFMISVIDESGELLREVDYSLLNEFIISFITARASNLAQMFNKLSVQPQECSHNSNTSVN